MDYTIRRVSDKKPEQVALDKKEAIEPQLISNAEPQLDDAASEGGFLSNITSGLSSAADWLGGGMEPDISSPFAKTMAIGGAGLATGAAGSIPSLVSGLASGGQWLGKAVAPEFQGLQSALGGIKSAAEYATPESLQGYLETLSGGYLKPETELQKGVAEYSQDVGSIAGLPGAGGLKAGVKLATAGNAAKKAAELFGAGENVANFAKVAGMVGAGLFKPGIARSLKGKSYKDVDKIARSGVNVVATDIAKKSKDLIKEASIGSAGWKRELIKDAEGALSKIKSGKIDLKEAWEFSKDLGESLFKGSDGPKKYAVGKDFLDSFKSALNNYGETNKAFGSAYQNANTLHSIEKGLPFIDKAISKIVSSTGKSFGKAGEKAINAALVYGVGGIQGLLAKASIEGLYKTGQQMIKSPVYRKAATDLAKATASGSIPATAKAIRKLEPMIKGTSNLKKEPSLDFTVRKKGI